MGERARNPVLRLFAFTTLLLTLTMGLAGFYAFGVSQRYLLPELDLKARTVGVAIADKVALAQAQAIPFDRFVGMDEYLDSVRQAQPDIDYLGITDTRGVLLYHAGLDQDDLRTLFGEENARGAPAWEDDDPDDEGGWALWLSQASLALSGPPVRETPPRGGYYDTQVPLVSQGQMVGTLHIGVSVGFYKEEIARQATDMIIAVVIALLITFELLLATTTLALSGPLDTLVSTLRLSTQGVFSRPLAGSAREIDRLAHRAGVVVDALLDALATLKARLIALQERHPERQARLLAIDQGLDEAVRPVDPDKRPVDLASVFIGARLGAFLFVLAEEITRPFMPVFIRGVAESSGWGQSDLIMGLPMSMFLLVVALSMPGVASASERLGRRRTFIAGAVLSSVGLVGAALGGGFVALLLWRALSGLGYAMTFVACQGHVLDHADPQQRARGVALFVGGITAADICGPAIGGMLATRLGFEAVLGIGGALAAGAALLGVWALRGQGALRPAPKAPRGTMFKLLGNGRFVVLLLCTAVPAKLLLSGALFFLVPLIATQEGASAGEVGRLVMVYGLASFLLATPFARQADRWGLHGLAVGVGALIAGLGLIPMVFDAGMPGVILAVVGLGVGQALSISPQLALVMRVCEDEVTRYGQAPVVGLYRLAERLGGALGPVGASALAAVLGYGGAMATLGAGAVVAAVVFCVVFLILGARPHPDDQIDDEEPLIRPEASS
ncbi:MFS transporter [Pararhodospirillum oryzae]|uniref:Major facilitator superfamily (MFS) profile domain-containing protein n=1 Tax=Pararhodospirillum oryzae TaxID=478448 RepID=A0A512H7D4_9PROT|nr:MFS transporter [Pararhodospirillum oryzae]GEO81290.1 hypothetical protein ROR02_14210 [Pararhodospirillum oryzae]